MAIMHRCRDTAADRVAPPWGLLPPLRRAQLVLAAVAITLVVGVALPAVSSPRTPLAAAPVPPPAAAPAQSTPPATLGPHELEVEGRVLVANVQDPSLHGVADAWVWLYAAPPGFCGHGTTTDADGHYALVCRGLPSASGLTLWAQSIDGRGGVRAAQQTWRVTAAQLGTRIQRDVSLSPPLPTPAPIPPMDSTDNRVYGRVVASAADGAPVPGAQVSVLEPWCDGRTVVADAAGGFAFRCPLTAIGCLELTADAPGYAAYRHRFCASATMPDFGLGHDLVLVLTPESKSPPDLLSPEADTWVEYDIGTGAPPREGPFGQEPLLEVGFSDVGLDQEGLLRLPPPPVGAPDFLQRAEIWLTVTGASSQSFTPDGGRDAAQLSFAPAHGPWDEATVNGTTRPLAGGPEFSAPVSAGLVRLDFTAPARAWLAYDRADGWVLRGSSLAEGPSTGAAVRLASRESSYGPRLVLYWLDDGLPTATPGPSPTSTLSATASVTPTASRSPAPSATLIIPPTDTPMPTPTLGEGRGVHFPWVGRMGE